MEGLIVKLDAQFPEQAIMDVQKIVIPNTDCK
jgi:hypothetical protein